MKIHLRNFTLRIHIFFGNMYYEFFYVTLPALSMHVQGGRHPPIFSISMISMSPVTYLQAFQRGHQFFTYYKYSKTRLNRICPFRYCLLQAPSGLYCIDPRTIIAFYHYQMAFMVTNLFAHPRMPRRQILCAANINISAFLSSYYRSVIALLTPHTHMMNAV